MRPRLATYLVAVACFAPLFALTTARADWPAKVFAPYMYFGGGNQQQLSRDSEAAGQKYFTLAFIIADRQNNPSWFGRVGIENDPYFAQINELRQKGGDVLVSFGGEGGTELAIAETDPDKLLAKYQAIIDRYHFTWLDFDIEGKGLRDSAANERRNTVIAKLQAKNPGLRVSFTLPVDPNGISTDSRNMLADAKSRGVSVFSANVMTMYFGPRFSKGRRMSDVSIASAMRAYEQCQAIDPRIQIGLTPLIGLNRQMNEDFTLEDAQRLREWASATPWVCSIGFWSTSRDSGVQRGRGGGDAAVNQTPWGYSKIFQQFTAMEAPATTMPTTVPSKATAVLRVLLLTGGDHDWRATTPFLRKILSDSGRFSVQVSEAPAGLTGQTLAGFAVVIDDYSGADLEEQSQRAIADFVEAGKGLVVTRAALDSLSRQPGLAKLAGVSATASSAKGRQTPTHFLKARIAQPLNPILAGFNGDLRIADSLEPRLSAQSQDQVVMSASEEGADGPQAPALITNVAGKARILSVALGHDLAAMQERLFIVSFVRGAEWAATGSVTLSADLGLPEPRADAVRTLLVTGGHDHEAAFYSLFDGYKDITWTPVANSALAFQKDFRDKYDVLILYDFTRDMDDNAKKNLRDFAEAGKGIVVLHHALLDFQQWAWWSQEVVGGKYRLAPEGGKPSSAALMGQDFYVTPQKHVITAGIAPFHLFDESYKRMTISPDVTPLLTTDNANSDSTIAWISPYAKSRVVYIQLGHGHGAFGHPSYRAIVHNAILWGAGRIN